MMIGAAYLAVLSLPLAYAAGRLRAAHLLSRSVQREHEAIAWAMQAEELIAHPGRLLAAKRKPDPSRGAIIAKARTMAPERWS